MAAIFIGIGPVVAPGLVLWPYWLAGAILIVSQLADQHLSRLAERAIEDLRATYRSVQRDTASIILHQLVNGAYMNDPLLKDGAIDFEWGVRVSRTDNTTLVVADFNNLGIDRMKWCGFAVPQVEVRADTPAKSGKTLWAAAGLHPASGCRFEFFYYLPSSVKMVDGRAMGSRFLKSLQSEVLLLVVSKLDLVAASDVSH